MKRSRDSVDTASPSKRVKTTSSFSNLKVGSEKRSLLAPTLAFLASKNFKEPSPVQDICIPAFLDNRDVAVEACTGSGKTLAFLIPVVERLYLRLTKVRTDSLDVPLGGFDGLCVGALIIAPTRELINQIHVVLKDLIKAFQQHEETKNLAKYLYSCEIFGGRPMKTDLTVITKTRASLPASSKDGLRPFGVVLANPGRLQSHFEGGKEECLKIGEHWTFRSLEVLILDEADRLYADQNFQSQMDFCLKQIPAQRRTGIFSATLTDELRNLQRAGLRAPVFIKLAVQSSTKKEDEKPDDENSELKSHSIPSSLSNCYVYLESTQKLTYLIKLIRAFKSMKKLIIFCSTCAYVNWLSMMFKEVLMDLQDAQFLRLHGNMEKAKRAKTVRAFRTLSGRRILISSDLAARGLDFEDVDMVVQFDPPSSASDFFHRIGRTARAGKSGVSLLFLDPVQSDYLPFLSSKGAPLDLFPDHQKVLNNSLELPTPAVSSIDEEIQQCVIESTNHPIEDHFRDECRSILGLIKRANISDRKYLELGKEAFVSKVKEMRENTLQFIFVFDKFEIGLLANSLGLLKLPRVKEILGRKVNYFVNSTIDSTEVRFKDEALQAKYETRQAERQKEILEAERKKKASQRKKKVSSARKLNKIANAWEDWEDLAETMREERREAKQFAGECPKSGRPKLWTQSSRSRKRR